MKVMLKQEAVRWKTIEVPDEVFGGMDASELDSDPELREWMWEDLQEEGWDGEDVLEASWEIVND